MVYGRKLISPDTDAMLNLKPRRMLITAAAVVVVEEEGITIITTRSKRLCDIHVD